MQVTVVNEVPFLQGAKMVQAHPMASPVKYVSHAETSQLACGARPVQDGYKCTCHDILSRRRRFDGVVSRVHR